MINFIRGGSEKAAEDLYIKDPSIQYSFNISSKLSNMKVLVLGYLHLLHCGDQSIIDYILSVPLDSSACLLLRRWSALAIKYTA